jgi:hypothetical protein
MLFVPSSLHYESSPTSALQIGEDVGQHEQQSMQDENILQNLHASNRHTCQVTPAIYGIQRLFTTFRRAHHCAR